MRGERARLERIVGREQPRAEIGLADAAAGIDARTENEADMIGVEPLADLRGIAQAPRARYSRAAA